MGLPLRAEVSPSATLDEVLSGRLGATAVAQIAVEPLRHGLAESMDRLVPGRRSGSLELQRTKYKPSRKLTAYYRWRTDDMAGTRHLAVSWYHHEPTTILVSPDDPTMPQLERLSDHEHLVTLLADLGQPGIESVIHDEIYTIRYRPGQRHVLNFRPGGGGPGFFFKTDRDDSGSRAVSVAEALGPELTMRCPQAAPAEPVGYSAEDRTAVWHHAAGQPLSQRLSGSSADAVHLVQLVGRAVRAMHDSQPAVVIGSHDVQSETTATLRAGEHIAALLPGVGRAYDVVVSQVVERLERWPADAASFTHGDVKCDNILVNLDQIRILDLDRSCWADPALDLGKFLADLRWWFPTAKDRADVLSAAFHAGYGACDAARWERASLLAVLFQLKFAARRCAVHDPRWSWQVQAQVADAAASLTERRIA